MTTGTASKPKSERAATMLPKIETILYCTELGPNSAYVFRYAYALAKKCTARIVVLHVVEVLSASQEAMVEGYAGKGKLHEVVEREEHTAAARLHKRIAAFCEKVVGVKEPGNVVKKILVAEGRVRLRILEHVESEGADLVVLGAHDESPVLAGLLGSTAYNVIRKSPVPVLLVQVPEGKQDLTMRNL